MLLFIEMHQPCSAAQVAAGLGITRQSVYEQHKKKKIRVVEWSRVGSGHATALYMIGQGRDKKRPEPLPQRVRSAAYMERHSAIIAARRPSKRKEALGPWKGLL